MQVGVIHHNRVHRDGSGLHRPAAGEKLIGICRHLVFFGTVVSIGDRDCFRFRRVIVRAEDVGADLAAAVPPGAEGIGQRSIGQGDEGLGRGKVQAATGLAQLRAVQDAVVCLAFPIGGCFPPHQCKAVDGAARGALGQAEVGADD